MFRTKKSDKPDFFEIAGPKAAGRRAEFDANPAYSVALGAFNPLL